jgi:heat shock protein HtpX
MFALVMQLGYLVSLIAGPSSGFSIIGFFAILAVLADIYAFYRCDAVVLHITRSRIVNREEAPMLHAIIDDLVIASGLPRPRIAICDDPAPNAFATGRDPQHSVVACTTGLLERLDKEEVRAVLAHEMAHIYNRDIFVSSVAAVAVRIVSIIANSLIMVGIGMLTAPSSSGRKTEEQQQAENAARMMGLGLLLIGSLLAVTFVPMLIILQFAISRTRESMADLTGAGFNKDPEALARALKKISTDPTETANPAQGISHLWISAPRFAGGGLGNWLSNLTSSHPNPEIRIETLMKASRGQTFDLAIQERNSGLGAIFALGLVAVSITFVPAYLIGARPIPIDYSANYPSDPSGGGDSGTSDGSNSADPNAAASSGDSTSPEIPAPEPSPSDVSGSIGNDPYNGDSNSSPTDVPSDSGGATGGIGGQ